MGMMMGEESHDCVLLRADDRPYRLWVNSSTTNGLQSVGWELPSGEALELAERKLKGFGLEVNRNSDLAAKRRVRELITFTAPDGTHHELTWCPDMDHLPFVSPVGVSGFVTGALGLGHVVLPVDAFDESYAFYTDVMGFRLSDLMTIDGTRVAFLRCNARHHSLALGEGQGPGLAHFMIEVGTIDDVGYGMDRAQDLGSLVRESLGRHTNDQMLSFYARTPSGFSVEYGSGGRIVDDSTWTPTSTCRGSYWGHRSVSSLSETSTAHPFLEDRS